MENKLQTVSARVWTIEGDGDLTEWASESRCKERSGAEIYYSPDDAIRALVEIERERGE